MDTNWISINNYKYPVTVLGPGKRIVVWTQGCSIRCEGCMSIHTWTFDEKKRVKINEFIDQLKKINCYSITISGGEPFDQKNFLFFLQQLKNNGFKDILVYSGYEYSYIKKHFKKYLYYIDVLISEPFEYGNETEKFYKGSDNQKAVIFNKKIFNKYKEFLTSKKNKNLQIFDDLIVGIPFQKDVERIFK